LKIVIFGAGVQGTVFAVRLAQAGQEVTLIARPQRASEVRQTGATIQDLNTGAVSSAALPVLETLPPDFVGDICLVTVRREQIEAILPALAQASAIRRIVFLVNHANGSADLRTFVGPSRTVLGFPGIAGYRDGPIVRYVDIPQQHTAVERTAHDVVSLLRESGFPVDAVADMDAWLERHAIFITAIAGALCENSGDASGLAQHPETIRRFIIAVRQGWAALDRQRVAPAPFALRVILCWVPLWISVEYWRRLFASPRGDLYFARHTRHALVEMAVLAADVRNLLGEGEAPELENLLASIRGFDNRFVAAQVMG